MKHAGRDEDLKPGLLKQKKFFGILEIKSGSQIWKKIEEISSATRSKRDFGKNTALAGLW